MIEICRFFGEILIVELEIKKEVGELKFEEEIIVGLVQKLVIEMGIYVIQSVFSSFRFIKKEEDRFFLRGFFLDGDFFVVVFFVIILIKIVLCYVVLVQEKKK